jgi:hypothetical protein
MCTWTVILACFCVMLLTMWYVGCDCLQDEIHERDRNADFLLVVLRWAWALYWGLSCILLHYPAAGVNTHDYQEHPSCGSQSGGSGVLILFDCSSFSGEQQEDLWTARPRFLASLASHQILFLSFAGIFFLSDQTYMWLVALSFHSSSYGKIFKFYCLFLHSSLCWSCDRSYSRI